MRLFLVHPLSDRRLLRWGVLLFAGLCFLALGLFLANDYRVERKSAEGLWQYRLSRLSLARAEQVARWAAARESDATDLANYPAISGAIGRRGEEEDCGLLARRLQVLARGYGYQAVCIEGEPSLGRLCSDSGLTLGASSGSPGLEQLRPGGCAIYPVSDLEGRPYLCVAARSRERGPAGGALLVVDPSQWLEPTLGPDLSFGPPVTFLLASAGHGGCVARGAGSPPPSADGAGSVFSLVRAGRTSERLPALETWQKRFFAVRQAIRGTDWVCVGLVPKGLAMRDMTRQFYTRAAAAGVLCISFMALVLGLGREMEVRHLRAISRQEERHRLLADNAAEMVLYLEEDGAIVDCNRAAESLSGLSRGELLGRELRELFLPSGDGEATPFLESAFEEGARAEGLWRQPGGGLVPVEASCRSVEIEGRRLAIFVARDISARKEAERKLTEYRRSLETLLANLPGMAYRCRNDRDWTMEFVSAGVRALTGYEPEELAGRNAIPYVGLIHPDDRERVWREVQEALERKESFTLTYRIRTKSGEERTVWERGCGVFEPGQGLAALEGFITDVSDRARAQEALRAAQDALDQARKLEAVGLVASGVAHEVRNPLFAISTIVTALDQKLKDRPEFGEYVGHIQDQVRRLSSLMNDLLLLGRPVETEGFRTVDLAAVARDAIRNLDQAAGGAQERCRLDSAGTGTTVKGSQERLEQVVMNLVQNALSFSPPGQPVHLRVRAEGSDAVLEVQDRGPGIPAHLLDHLFEPFQSRRKGGTGLGLAIVRKIVTAHGGTVQAENVQSPSGARFTVRIPLSNPRGA